MSMKRREFFTLRVAVRRGRSPVHAQQAPAAKRIL